MSATRTVPAEAQIDLAEHPTAHLAMNGSAGIKPPAWHSGMNESPAVVVFGERSRSAALADELALDGYQVHPVSNLEGLRMRCTAGDVELVIFGNASPRGPSLDVLRALRTGNLAPQIDPGVRVLWMSTASDVTDALRAFEAGADDVIRAPFIYAELLARVRALLRRNLADVPVVLHYGALRIDTAARKPTFGGTPIDLRRKEYTLLVHLARDPGRVYTKDELLRDVWGFRSQGSTRTVDSHASRLRRKLALAGAEGWVTSEWGVGYRLAPDAHGPLRALSGGFSG